MWFFEKKYFLGNLIYFPSSSYIYIFNFVWFLKRLQVQGLFNNAHILKVLTLYLDLKQRTKCFPFFHFVMLHTPTNLLKCSIISAFCRVLSWGELGKVPKTRQKAWWGYLAPFFFQYCSAIKMLFLMQCWSLHPNQGRGLSQGNFFEKVGFV